MHLRLANAGSDAKSGRSYRPDIDGLRALAVIAVIAHHFNRDLLPSGFLGVDMFFVISGYVISISLASHDGLSVCPSRLNARRVKRLMPALIVCVLVTAAVTIAIDRYLVSFEPA